jgi:hypothetical protein
MARDSTTTWLPALAGRVRDLDAVFSCGGTVELAAPVGLRFQDGRTLRIARDDGWRSTDVGKRLIRRCEPAPFGVGRQTRRDRRVRHGWQLSARDGAFEVLGLDLGATGILEEVRRALCPELPSAPDAELHAVNVYKDGGHFVSHKDTPRDRDCFGTLVVCLPVPFQGGRLVLRHNDTTRSYAWESYGFAYPMPGKDPYEVRWAAFYGDVDHAIDTVTGGTRITLTWLLRHPRGGRAATREAAASDDELGGDLIDALADLEFMPSGGTLGVPCLHLYGETARLALPRALSRDDASRLKGRDRLVAQSALRAGLEIQVRPYIHEDCANDSWRLSRAPSSAEIAVFDDEQLGLSELERVLPVERRIDVYDVDDVTWVVPPPWERRARDETTSRDADPAADPLGTLEFSATDYFGNEGGTSTFYASAALLVTIPSARERGHARTRVPFDLGSELEPSSVPPQRDRRPLGEPATDALEDLVGSMTVAELCRRCGISIESLAKFCLAAEDTFGEPET